ncbi:SDR family oxidoreductase [Corallococcus macrosporus]|uniref:Short chain dehydrogenase/reductase family oxidoreductase n=1 Tax=Myxococcus fulvus (strain ATCC BAA-855 / HW-1) TaxID=483219 RepID=F8CH69_MYXFH|nr:SDR family oxidoreductase [Corallococcus macrosporus]AEI64986.1 short chain dehydrogenase/reductase family oxidoreductase [Corallococcus macrosporus]
MNTSRRKVVLITGASSGIGQACAEVLGARGHAVHGTSRHPRAHGAHHRMQVLDVTDDDSVRRAVAAVLAAEGRLDVVVNCAGFVLSGAVEDVSIDEARRQLDTNFLGVLRVCQAVLPTMRAQRSGLIVNISSMGGAAGLPFQGLYSASKFALEGLTESLRLEVASFGIEATLLQPGDVRTRVREYRVRAQRSGPGSAYRETFERVMALVESGEGAGVAPEQVARKVLSLVERQRVDVRYSVGHLSQRAALVSKRLLPARTFEHIVMALHGLSRR